MKKSIITFLVVISLGSVYIQNIYANDNPDIWQNAPETSTTVNNTTNWINRDISTDNVLGVPNNNLRTGRVDMNTIPLVLINVMNVMLGIAGTVSVVALIYYAVQMQINSGITGDSSGVDKAKTWMKWAIFGFILAILAWFIIVRLIEVLSSVF